MKKERKMVQYVFKRNGETQEFDSKKIANAKDNNGKSSE